MNTLKSLFIVVTVTVTLMGCTSVKQVTERGQVLHDASPAAYEAMTGEVNYSAQNPQFNVHGS